MWPVNGRHALVVHSRSFRTAAPTIWNSFSIRSSHTFRKHLKTNLFQSAFSNPWRLTQRRRLFLQCHINIFTYLLPQWVTKQSNCLQELYWNGYGYLPQVAVTGRIYTASANSKQNSARPYISSVTTFHWLAMTQLYHIT